MSTSASDGGGEPGDSLPIIEDDNGQDDVFGGAEKLIEPTVSIASNSNSSPSSPTLGFADVGLSNRLRGEEAC